MKGSRFCVVLLLVWVSPLKFYWILEWLLGEVIMEGHLSKESSMMVAHIKKYGPYIPGEVKVVMTLRILVGASYLDMCLWFNVNLDYVIYLTRSVMKD